MDHYADIEGMADRLVVGWQLDHGWTPRSILIPHYDALLRHSKTASDANRYRQARDAVSGLGFLKFVYDLAKGTGLALADLVNLFKDSRVVRFFSKIKWSMEKMFGLLKEGYKKMKGLQEALMEYARNSAGGKWVAKQLDSETLREIDLWLERHPKTRVLAGAGMAGLLVYIWWNMSYVGNPVFDFDLSDVLDALTGSFSLSNLFSGAKGVTLLLLFLTGSVGIGFGWPGAKSIHFAISVIVTLAKKLGKKMMKTKEPAEQQAEDLGLEDAIPGGA
jgi:hypothetical protein